MKAISISARTVSGVIGLTVCYSLSLYFFWDSLFSTDFFGLDPRHSRVTKNVLNGLIGRDNAKPVGVVLAFLSVHASWALRYTAGDIIEKIGSRYFSKTKSSPSEATGYSKSDLRIIKDVTILEDDKILIESVDNAEDSTVLKKEEDEDQVFIESVDNVEDPIVVKKKEDDQVK